MVAAEPRTSTRALAAAMGRCHSRPWRASSALAAALAALATRPVAAIQPRPDGHFLTNTELRNITAVACLEARQRNPAVRCLNGSLMTRPLAGGTFSGQLNAGNYPNYQDTVCNSNGEYFCDPASVFSMEERQGLTAELRTLRENHPVTCGHLLNDPVDPRHYQPFYLGVAMATKWPSGESDPDSLQQFGQIIAAEWSMDRLFVGSPQPYLRCPNTAILIFLPEIRRAFVSSASCEFICQDRGGPEVATAALAALDNEGPVAAVRAAMREAYSIVSRTSSGPGHEQARATAQLSAGGNVRVDGSAAGHAVVTQGRTEETTPGGITSVVVQRILFGFALVALIVSVLIAFAVIFLAPSLFTSRRRRK